MLARGSSVLLVGCLALVCVMTPESLDFSGDAAPSGLGGGAGVRVFLEHPFGDDHADLVCGGKRQNRSGTWSAAPLACPEPPGAYVSRLLRSQLEAAGFELLDEVAVPDAGDLRVGGHVVVFLVRSYAGSGAVAHEAKIRTRLELRGAGLSEDRIVDGRARRLERYDLGLALALQDQLDLAMHRLQRLLVAEVLSFAHRAGVGP